MKIHRARIVIALMMAMSFRAQSANPVPPPPTLVMPGSSKPLAAQNTPKTTNATKTTKTTVSVQTFSTASAVIPSVQMKILVLAGDSSEYSYQSITTFLTQIGVPYTGVAVDSLTPDSQGNRLSNLALTDPATGQGLYQGIIETNSNFSVCNPTCAELLTATDWSTLDTYASGFQVRVVSYYTWPEARWGLTPVGSGAAYTASSPLSVKLTAAGASIFSYINAANAIPVGGSGSGSIWAYNATPVAATGETTTPILTAGTSTVGVTHTAADGRETLSLTFDNYPTLLHSLAFSYGVVNWVTKGVFLGARQIYLNPQDDDILFGDRLYAPTLPQCPDDPACPDVEMTSADLQALSNWQTNRQTDPQFPYLRTTFAYVGLGATFGPVYAQEAQTMVDEASDYGWVSHGYTHGDPDCFTVSSSGMCLPATLQQSLADLQVNNVFGAGLGLPVDYSGYITPFNNGLGNQAYLQAAAWVGITSVITADAPPSINTGLYSPVVPSLYLIPRRVTNLLWDEDSPSTGVYGSLPDEYNSYYGPNGSTPFFDQNQTYSQIMDNESNDLLLLHLMTYEPYPLGFHTSNSVTYDGVHSLMTDLFDATIQKYKSLYNLPVYTLKDMRDIAPILRMRETYNASGVKGVYTPGVSVVLTTATAATIPITGACSQPVCPRYGGQMQDSVSMAAQSSVTLSLSAGTGSGLSAVAANPVSVGSLSPSTGLVTLNGIATSNAVISLSSDNAAAVVPASVTINPGDLGASFTIAIGAVTSATTATITAAYSGITKSTVVTITPAVAISSVTLSPATVSGGATSTGTVTLTSAAPAGGFVIPLISDNSAVAIPSTVTIPAGSSTATFSVSTSAVTGTTTGNIVAIYNYVTRSAVLTVTAGSAVTLSGVSLNPTQVAGGTSSAGTVTLTGPAPAGGIQVSLSSNVGSASVPSTVTVPAGSSSMNFNVTTTAVASTVTAAIQAVYGGITQTADLTITPPAAALSGVSLNPTSVSGGSSSTGTVTLTAVAPAGGITVALTSGSGATVPSNVIVAAGNTTANFTVTTQTVSSPASPVISASYSGVTKTATLTVVPAVALSAVSLNPVSVVGGTASTGTVTLTGTAPAGGLSVSLSSNSTSATVPATVNVAAGQTSATFSVTTTTVTSTVNAVVSAIYSGVTKTATLAITPGGGSVTLSTFTITPTSLVGGNPATGKITLAAAAPSGGAAISLSSNSSAATVPATVTVAAGSTSATFTIATAGVTATTSVLLTASSGSSVKTASLSVKPAVYSGLALNPLTVAGGSPSTGTVTFTGAAPAGGLVVTLSSNNPLATVPASVTVPAGSLSATFPISTSAANYTAKPAISGKYQSTTIVATLTIAGMTSVTLSPASVKGGASSTGTVKLTAAAPAGGAVIALTSSNPAAVVPASVTVPSGSTSATFKITTTAVPASTSATIGATLGGLTETASLAITH